jgi:Ca2+-binding RTX toxin-like protein
MLLLSDNAAGSAPVDPAQLKKGGFGVRRTILLLSAMALVLSLAAGVALAQKFGDQGGQGVTKTCNTSCNGTQYPDTLKGTSNRNHIDGEGTKESPNFGDLIQGFANHDTLNGDKGGDKIEGGNGDDIVNGDNGNDQVIGGSGNDHISTGRGNDLVRAVDNQQDHVDCGQATSDRVFYDRNLDILSDCERRNAR